MHSTIQLFVHVLIITLTHEPDIARFKNTLKTYFFKLAFDLLG